MCDKSPYNQFILTQLQLALESEELTPTEKNQLMEARKIYEQNCSTCAAASNDDTCISMALDELLRMMPGKDKWKLYPWKNYEWDYSNFIDNNFSAKATGSSPNGLLNNMFIFIKLIQGYIRDPNPGTGSIAGGTSMYDTESDYPVHCVNENEFHRQKARFDVGKNSPTNKNPPYDDPFFKKSLNGEHASSYFVRVGSCPREDITDREECAKKNFEWKSGNCYQPRYAYMNNRSLPIRGIQGAIPSLAYSVLAFTPTNVAKAFSGKSNSRMIVQKCPNLLKGDSTTAEKKETSPIKEKFLEYNPDRQSSRIQFGFNEAMILFLSAFLGYYAYDTLFKNRK